MIDPRVASADELLQALTVGDLSAADPAVSQRLAAEPRLAERWRRLAATLAQLRELDSGLRDGATAPASAGGARDPADPSLDARAVVRAFRRRRQLRRTLGALAAVAAALFAAWLLFATAQPANDPVLGPQPPVAGLEPNGVAWESGQPLRWPAVRGATGYGIEVRAAEGARVLTLPGSGRAAGWFPGESWLPTAAERATLPERFEWRVIAYDDFGPIDHSPWARTRR